MCECLSYDDGSMHLCGCCAGIVQECPSCGPAVYGKASQAEQDDLLRFRAALALRDAIIQQFRMGPKTRESFEYLFGDWAVGRIIDIEPDRLMKIWKAEDSRKQAERDTGAMLDFGTRAAMQGIADAHQEAVKRALARDRGEG